jgi:hypothetical protein
MRTTLAAVGLTGAICLFCCQSAAAVPASAAIIKETAPAALTLRPVQYYERHTRHRVIKCYRELVIGPYVCHAFYRW